MDEVDEGLKKEMNTSFNTMEDNTQVNNDEKQLKIVKLAMPASVVDFLMEHYGFFDLVEVNQLSLYILKTLGHMETDGFKFAVYRKVDDKVESYELDIHELIAKFRIGLSGAIREKKLYEPDISIKQKESNEKDSV